MPRSAKAGFTLSELMVTVAIIAILASMAVPRYEKTVRRGHQRAAEDILQTIAAGQKVRQAAAGTFIALTATSPNTSADGPCPCWRDIFMDNPNTVSGQILPVQFEVTIPAAGQFTATARHTPTNQTMTIDQADNQVDGDVEW